jgi:ABC-type transport system involved in multi-copper enzyme maturation permease subunit
VIRHLPAFMLMDARVHWRYFSGMFGMAALLAVFGPSAGGMSKANVALYLIMFTVVAAPIVVPWWTVGNDRDKGTMWMIVSLPLDRSEIVLLKTLETLIWTAAMGAFSAVIIVALGASTTWLGIYILALPVAVAMSFLSTATFFLLPSRVAMFALYGLFFLGVKLFKPIAPRISDLPSPTLLALLFVAMFTIAFASYRLAATLWSRKISPCT